MKFDCVGTFRMIPRQLLRSCGYHEFVDPNTRETSYIRQLGAQFYPRFHIYLKPLVNGFTVDLHLDQKHASYSGSSKHNGEYDGEVVENEGRRIAYVIVQARITSS